jgi:hypothetical protein
LGCCGWRQAALAIKLTATQNPFLTLSALRLCGESHLLALNLLSIAIMICFQAPKLLMSRMPERTQKPPTPVPWEPKQGGGEGPRSPDVSKPDTKDLLKRMRKVDPNQSKRYRQRTGE